eukprot:SAG31_NODE_16659_length_701_cov_0.995017_1_plen_42_part_10
MEPYISHKVFFKKILSGIFTLLSGATKFSTAVLNLVRLYAHV